ncbi:MAG TPA: hypothetical protein VFM04_05095 [Candidatus Methylomirabilis sp.]|nr:hypothetical protein [Candidatus Methylomirabilis sp.]
MPGHVFGRWRPLWDSDAARRPARSRKLAEYTLLGVLVFLGSPVPAQAWGPAAHVLINRAACTTLPEPLRQFFMKHQAFIGEHSVDPDAVLAEQHGETERIRHWFALNELDRFPFREIPRNYSEALTKYGRERLESAGLLPWRIAELYRELVETMRGADWKRVPLVAAHLGHYVADGHQPLHTTTNRDGQLTGNEGIHKRFEDEMIGRHLAEYQDLAAFTQPAKQVVDPVGFTFEFLIDSHVWVDNLLRADTLARHGLSDFGDAYYAALQLFAGRLAKLSMAQAATDLGSLWYGAWVEAGRPKVP